MSTESLHIVCPNCQATNRLPNDRLSAAPNCGKCAKPAGANCANGE